MGSIGKEMGGRRPLNFACYGIQECREREGPRREKIGCFCGVWLWLVRRAALPIRPKLNLKKEKRRSRRGPGPFVTVGRTLFYIRVLYNVITPRED